MLLFSQGILFLTPYLDALIKLILALESSVIDPPRLETNDGRNR
jgi:hypothetical protein